MRYHEFRAMNTDILLAAEGSLEQVEEGFQRTADYIAQMEQKFTRFSEESELAALNRSAGAWFKASPEMFTLISSAYHLHIRTQGLFDPAILPALEFAGYDRTFDQVGGQNVYLPDLPLKEKPLHFRDLRRNSQEKAIWLPPGLRVDLGGIAKGWIAEQAAGLLAQWSAACAVDAGGDAFMVGLPEGESHWRITLEDPHEMGKGLMVLKTGPGAIATSTVTHRRWQQEGQPRHHLIDPRTQQPAQTDWLSVTVFAPHAAEAEVFAKCLLIGGSFEVNRISTLAGEMDFIAIDQQLKMWGSKNSQEFIDG